MYDDLQTYLSKDDVVIFQSHGETMIGKIVGIKRNYGVKVKLLGKYHLICCTAINYDNQQQW